MGGCCVRQTRRVPWFFNEGRSCDVSSGSVVNFGRRQRRGWSNARARVGWNGRPARCCRRPAGSISRSEPERCSVRRGCRCAADARRGPRRTTGGPPVPPGNRRTFTGIPNANDVRVYSAGREIRQAGRPRYPRHAVLFSLRRNHSERSTPQRAAICCGVCRAEMVMRNRAASRGTVGWRIAGT